MNKFALTILISACFFASGNVLASSPHPEIGSPSVPVTFPIIGNFQSSCSQGSASIDVRTVSNGGHNQSVVHMETQGNSSVQANVLNLNGLKVSKPIKFDLISGVGANLILVVRYTIPHTNLQVTVPYGSPGQAPVVPPQRTLLPLGHGTGTYQIKIGRSEGEIPSQAALDLLYFYQLPTANPNCNIITNEVNDLNLNGRNVPIDLSTPSQSCTIDCVSAR